MSPKPLFKVQEFQVKKVKSILLILILVLLFVAAIQNNRNEDVKFLFWTFSSSMWVIILVSAVFGLLTGLVISFPIHGRKKKDIDNSG
jgi:uncharacterized integral membrane protein